MHICCLYVNLISISSVCQSQPDPIYLNLIKFAAEKHNTYLGLDVDCFNTIMGSIPGKDKKYLFFPNILDWFCSQPSPVIYVLAVFLRGYIVMDVKWLLNIHSVPSLRLNAVGSLLFLYAYRERNCSTLNSTVHLWSNFQHCLQFTTGDQQNAQCSALDIHIIIQLYNINRQNAPLLN